MVGKFFWENVLLSKKAEKPNSTREKKNSISIQKNSHWNTKPVRLRKFPFLPNQENPYQCFAVYFLFSFSFETTSMQTKPSMEKIGCVQKMTWIHTEIELIIINAFKILWKTKIFVFLNTFKLVYNC